MDDFLLNEPFRNQRHQDLIHEAEAYRQAKAAQKRNKPVSHKSISPFRRAAYLVAALIR